MRTSATSRSASLRRACSRSKYTLPLQNTIRCTCWAGTSSISPITRAKPPPLRSSSEDTDSSCLRSEEHTSELQSHVNLVCRLLLEKKKKITNHPHHSKKKQTHNK